MKIREVVTGFLHDSGNILILKRSQKVGSFRGRWAGVSGYVEKENTPEEQMYIEILEETGLDRDDLDLLRKTDFLDVADLSMGITWRIHPFLFKIQDPAKIKIDWEHTEYKWIKPEDLKIYDTVPSLYETLKTVL